MPTGRLVVKLACITTFFCLHVGCRQIWTIPGLPSRDVTAEAHVSEHQLRVMVNEFVIYSTHRIELCADEVLAGSHDNKTRKSALLWKINGISACFQAASRPKAQGAFLDLWILNRQTIQFLNSPRGLEHFGSWRNRIIKECVAFDNRLLDMSQNIDNELGIGEEFVESFANDFPLTSLYFDREPIATRYIEKVKTPSHELFEVVANLDGNIDDMKKLTILYAEHLPKQARWEAELFLLETAQLAVVQSPLRNLEVAADAISRIADMTQSIPQIVENERRALTDLVDLQRQATLLELEEMRRETVSQFATERSIVLAAISQERNAVLASLQDERISLTDELNREISRTLLATDTMTRQRIDEMADKTPKLIDHFFWRVLQVCLVVGLLGGLLAWLLAKRLNQGRSLAQGPFESDALQDSRFSVNYTQEQNRAA